MTGDTRSCVALIPMLRGNNVLLAKATFTGTSQGNSDVDGAVYFVSQADVYCALMRIIKAMQALLLHVLIGASRSEPHTSDVNRDFLFYMYMYVPYVFPYIFLF